VAFATSNLGNIVGNYYNGYSWDERWAKEMVMNRLIARGEVPKASGQCTMCGDRDAKVEYHGEDYGLPYIWTEPATYILCQHCHRQRLHRRFDRPFHWLAYLAHIRRGGYGSDLKTVPSDPAVKAEFAAYVDALKNGQPFDLLALRPYDKEPGLEWFAGLTMDPASLKSPPFRCRP
jgi:hypothetical protein